MPTSASADDQPDRRIGLRRVRAGVRSGDRRGARACGRGAARLEARARRRARRDLPPDGRADGRARRPARPPSSPGRSAGRSRRRPFEIRRGFQERAQLHGRHRAGCAGRRRRRAARGLPALHPPRAARRRAGAGAVELSVPGLGERRRPRHHGRQHRDPEDGAADAARRRAVRRGVRGGRPARRRLPVSARRATTTSRG